MPEIITTTQPIAIRAVVSYPAIACPGLDQWALHIAAAFGASLPVDCGLGQGFRTLAFDFASVDRIGHFIAAIESNPGCSVRIGKAEAELC